MKNKKIFIAVATTFICLSGLVLVANNKNVFNVSAEDCDHSGTIEHYAATATTIEHWACCDCHQAWADEAKTIVVRDTEKDVTRSDTKIQYDNYWGDAEGENYGWADNSVAVYDSAYGFAYKHDLTHEANTLYAEVYNFDFDFETNDSYQIEVTNNTTAFLQAGLLHASWNSCGGIHTNIPAGEKGLVNIPSDIIGGDNGKAFVVKMHNNHGTAFTGSVTVSRPIPAEEIKEEVQPTYTYQLDYNNSHFSSNYDEDRGFIFKTNGSNFTKGATKYVETVGPAAPETAKGMSVTLTNETNAALTVAVRSRAWNSIYFDDSLLEVGESRNIVLSKAQWNDNPSGSNYGFALWITNHTDVTDVNGYLTITEPVVSDFEVANTYNRVDINSTSGWITKHASIVKDENLDYVYETYTSGATEVLFTSFDKETTLADDKMYYAQFTNNTDKELWVRFRDRGWGIDNNAPVFTVKAGETVIIYAYASTWNHHANEKGICLWMAPTDGGSFTGYVNLSDPIISDLEHFGSLDAGFHIKDIGFTWLDVKLCYDKTYGLHYSFDASNGEGTLIIYFKNVVKFTSHSHIRFHIYNGGTTENSMNVINESWGDPQTWVEKMTANAWTTVDVLAETWNGSSSDIGLYDHGFNGQVKITLGELITK